MAGNWFGLTPEEIRTNAAAFGAGMLAMAGLIKSGAIIFGDKLEMAKQIAGLTAHLAHAEADVKRLEASVAKKEKEIEMLRAAQKGGDT